MPAARIAAFLALLAGTPAAHAAVNGPCQSTAAHPHPAVIVHGRSGHFTDMVAISNALEAAGYCVFGADYGHYNGQTGLDHLTVSGGQLGAFINQVLAQTGAQKVVAIGYSEGTGVIQDFILAKGGASKVHRVVSFGGLHHPYAHAGAPGFADSDLFLPNLIVAARVVDPNITAQEVITSALALYAGAGGQLAGIDRAVAESPFASDLFDPVYWTALHDGLSEPNGTYIRLATGGHSLPTKDRGIGVCYTNIVATLDPITGASAGFQDPGEGIENFVLVSTADHGTIISDAGAIAKMIAGLAAPCSPTAGGDPADPDDDGDGGDDGGGGDGDDDGGDDPGGATGGLESGCAATGSLGWLPALLVLGLARARRRRPHPPGRTRQAA